MCRLLAPISLMRRIPRCCNCCTARFSIMHPLLLWCYMPCEASCPTYVRSVPQDRIEKESFFNWFYFAINLGSLLAVTAIVYVQVGALYGHRMCIVRAFVRCPSWCIWQRHMPHAALLKQTHRRGLICSHLPLSLRCVVMYRTTFRGRLALASLRLLWFWPLSCSWLGRRATHMCHRQRGTAALMPALHEHCMSRPAASGLTSTRHLTLRKSV
jgi:POT family